MTASLKSILLVFGVLLIGLSLAWFQLRNSGLKTPPRTHETGFFESIRSNADRTGKSNQDSPRREVIAYQGASNQLTPPNSLDAFSNAARLGEAVILWADVQMSEEGKVIISNSVGDSVSDSVGDSVHDSISKRSSQNKKSLLLDELLALFPKNRLIINVVEYRPGLDTALAKSIDRAKAGDRVLIQSDQDGILRDLRRLRPLWLFGTSQAQVTKLRMLMSIGLGPAAPLTGDVLVLATLRGDFQMPSVSLVNEAHRRGMKVLAGPVREALQGSELKALGVDGVITPVPENFIQSAP